MFYLNAKDIDAKVNTEVTAIDRDGHCLSFRNVVTGETGSMTYDKLIIATGSVPRMPPVPGVGLDRITTLRSRCGDTRQPLPSRETAGKTSRSWKAA